MIVEGVGEERNMLTTFNPAIEIRDSKIWGYMLSWVRNILGLEERASRFPILQGSQRSLFLLSDRMRIQIPVQVPSNSLTSSEKNLKELQTFITDSIAYG